MMLQERLQAFGAVLVEGPKWCGKTKTAEQIAKSEIKLQDTDRREEYLATAATKPSLLLMGETPRLIDEWQDAPVLWDAVRTLVDKRGKPGQFILTGSNAVNKGEIRHTGTGRISRMKMFPMSLWEYGESNGKISLRELFDNPSIDIDGITNDMTIEDLVYSACRGGWPATLEISSRKSKLLVAKDYIKTVCNEDVSSIDGVKRNPRISKALLRSYARNISTLAKKSSIVTDINASGEVSITDPTFDDYETAFKNLFIIQNIDAWCPSIRSKTAIRSGIKRSFVDPSIAVAAMGIEYEALLIQLKTFGFIFEQMCIRDLRVYTQEDLDSRLSYYRDRYGLEADLVVHLSDGRYALIECKLGSKEIEEGANHLLELRSLIREKNKTEKQVPLREPDLMIVLTGGHCAYTREDGVKVIPLACLRN